MTVDASPVFARAAKPPGRIELAAEYMACAGARGWACGRELRAIPHPPHVPRLAHIARAGGSSRRLQQPRAALCARAPMPGRAERRGCVCCGCGCHRGPRAVGGVRQAQCGAENRVRGPIGAQGEARGKARRFFHVRRKDWPRPPMRTWCSCGPRKRRRGCPGGPRASASTASPGTRRAAARARRGRWAAPTCSHVAATPDAAAEAGGEAPSWLLEATEAS
jgi:hypothetical protein